MADQLLLPPAVPRERAVEVWAEMIDAGEALLRAGFANRFGPEHVEEHYQEWCKEQIEENDRSLYRLLSELSRRESGNAE